MGLLQYLQLDELLLLELLPLPPLPFAMFARIRVVGMDIDGANTG
jgi:hypothetical protein